MEKKLIIEKLKSENELKTKWLSLIAHDFKGMFHNIVYLLKLLFAFKNRDNNNLDWSQFRRKNKPIVIRVSHY